MSQQIFVAFRQLCIDRHSSLEVANPEAIFLKEPRHGRVSNAEASLGLLLTSLLSSPERSKQESTFHAALSLNECHPALHSTHLRAGCAQEILHSRKPYGHSDILPRPEDNDCSILWRPRFHPCQALWNIDVACRPPDWDLSYVLCPEKPSQAMKRSCIQVASLDLFRRSP